ncbi:homocysteine methyltransferase [Clostridium tetani]|nr:homocysteine methyltransferase [Clostridium tetani]
MELVKIKDILGKEILIFDGAMGTMLQKYGLAVGEIPEILNIKEREKIIEIHKKYIEAGANIITINTFGANDKKLLNTGYSVEDIIEAAVENAKIASKEKNIAIALDIGPIGELIEPMGTLSFEEAYNIFQKQVLQGVKRGVDLILIETMSDLYETKAAILAAKENSNLPIFCTMTFEEDGRTFTGCSIPSMVTVLQGLGVDALGVNCSLGPLELESIVKEMLKYSQIPVMVQPNAGLPKVIDGKTLYKITPEEFLQAQKRMVDNGVAIVGGCCGTDNNFIKLIAKEFKGKKVINKKVEKNTMICTPSKTVIVDEIKIVGERINPTGKKILKESLKNKNMNYVLKEAINQLEEGADILDINVGLPDIDEGKIMVKVIKEIQSVLDIPLQIDSNDPEVIEKALRAYNGKAIVNSVNGEEENLNKILPIIKKYGASIIGLTFDEKGIPLRAEERFHVAKKIVDKAMEYGIKREDIIIDCLTLTTSAQQKEVLETLKALTLVKKNLGVKTTLGVSNISFGLPNRELLNRTFLNMALFAGLDLPIINTKNREIVDTIKAFKVLSNVDIGGEKFIKEYGGVKKNKEKVDIVKDEELKEIIIKGLRERAVYATKELLKKKTEIQIVEEDLVPALDIVGDRYEKGEVFLPQLIQSAETVQKAFEILKETLTLKDKKNISKGKIVLATVKGDVHDIGKNIVKTLLENYGYTVIDLGKDVSKEKIAEEVKKNEVKLVGLSALMTTTVKSMEETIEMLKNEGLDCKIMVGGAVLNEEYANMIKADYYAKDAKDAIKIARKVI